VRRPAPAASSPRLDLHRESSAEQLARVIREQVLQGAIPPGTPLREPQIVASAGVSRSTAREALRLLAFEGLVEHSLHRGAMVRQLSPTDIEDVYRVRRLVEAAAADAGPTLSPQQRSELTGALDDLERAAAGREWRSLVEADLAFHRALVALHGSERLDRLQRALELELRLAFSITAYVEREFDDPDPIVADHRLILEHLLDGDAAGFRARLLDHLNRHERAVIRVLEALDD
jgi:DNA-binding GntR family transcriptional regulator